MLPRSRAEVLVSPIHWHSKAVNVVAESVQALSVAVVLLFLSVTCVTHVCFEKFWFKKQVVSTPSTSSHGGGAIALKLVDPKVSQFSNPWKKHRRHSDNFTTVSCPLRMTLTEQLMAQKAEWSRG